MFCFIFIGIVIKINHLYLLSSSDLHTFPTLAPYGYDVLLSKVCSLLLSLLVSAISVNFFNIYILCASLLNLFCGFNMISLFSNQFLSSLNFSIPFITHCFVPWAFYYQKLCHNFSS